MDRPGTGSADTLYGLLKSTPAPAGGDAGMIPRALHAIRTHLDMDVACVSEFVDGRTVFRQVDAPGMEALIKVGDSRSLDDVYCRHILEGRLPEIIPDAAREPVAAAMPITTAVPIGAHMSVPIRLSDGRLYGMFCCLSSRPDPTLNPRDLQMMRVFADLTAFEIDKELKTKTEDRMSMSRIRTGSYTQRTLPQTDPVYTWEDVSRRTI